MRAAGLLRGSDMTTRLAGDTRDSWLGPESSCAEELGI